MTIKRIRATHRYTRVNCLFYYHSIADAKIRNPVYVDWEYV
jgi:hypothetical protein